MEHKTTSAEATITDLGKFEAIAATYTLDRHNEQIRPGAFRNTIESWQASGKQVPVHWNHRGEASNVIGGINPHSMVEVDEGLFVEGRLDLTESEVAREAWRSMKANRVALSFGYLVTDQHKRTDGVIELRSIDLFEISIVPARANPSTRILSTKAEHPSGGGRSAIAAEAGEVIARALEAAGTPASDAELLARPKALGIDLDRKSSAPIRIASFEV